MGDGTCYLEACVTVPLGFYKVLYKGGAEGFAGSGAHAADKVVSLLKLMGLEVSTVLLPEAIPVLGGVE